MLQLKHVTKEYSEGGATFTALSNINLTVGPGEFVAIIGPSGSGKSTLLSIAGALLHPTNGEVLINGQNIAALPENELSQVRLHHLGFILQTANLLPYLTVIDQLLIVAKMAGKVTDKQKQFANELLTELGLVQKATKFPNELSGGERQRVAIARAFMNGSDIILADEPTASLDSNRAFEVVQLIAKEVKNRQKAAIMVTHDERMLAFCDRVYHMADGMLVEQKELVTV